MTSGCHVLQTINGLNIYVEGHPSNISIKLNWNYSRFRGEDGYILAVPPPLYDAAANTVLNKIKIFEQV